MRAIRQGAVKRPSAPRGQRCSPLTLVRATVRKFASQRCEREHEPAETMGERCNEEHHYDAPDGEPGGELNGEQNSGIDLILQPVELCRLSASHFLGTR